MNNKLEKEIDKLKTLSIEELSKKFKCKPEEICIGDYIAKTTSDKVCPYKVILGFANFENSNVTDLGDLQIVYGKKVPERNINDEAIYLGLYVSNSKISNLGRLKKGNGRINLNDKIKDMGNIEFLGSNFYTNGTKIKSLGNKLKEIDGRLNIENDYLESTGNLKKVKDIYLESTKIKDLGEIESFKGIEIRFAYRKDVEKCEILETLKNLIKIKKFYSTEKRDVNKDRYSDHSVKVLTNLIKEDIIRNLMDKEYSIEFLEEKYKYLKNKDEEYLQKQKEITLKDYDRMKEIQHLKCTPEEYYIKYLKESVKNGLLKSLKSITVDSSKFQNESIKFISDLQKSLALKAQTNLNKLGFKIKNMNNCENLKELLVGELISKLEQAEYNINKINKKDPYYMNYLKLTKSISKNYKLENGEYKKVEQKDHQDDLKQ